AFKGIAEGVENSNFLLRTEAGSFILTLFEKRVNRDDLPFFLGLMDHLSAKGLTCPEPIKRRDGAVLGELCGRPATIISFLDGVAIRRPRAEHCRKLGEVLARFHIATGDFALVRPNTLSLCGWKDLFATIPETADAKFPGLRSRMERELAQMDKVWPTGLPSGTIHADLFTDNVFFLGDEVSGLIDFYFACTDAFAYDLVICLNAWCFEPDLAFNVTKARALVAGYQSVRKLEPAEVEALPLLARGAAIRFLVTRLYDWLTVPEGALVVPKDPKEYATKLAFHQGVFDARFYGIDFD
ncbi:MAG: homoserine kinase, partial [Devosiaceae bacterium]|nr:homoserine kinase [Devosiaceae bacterium MH13]